MKLIVATALIAGACSNASSESSASNDAASTIGPAMRLTAQEVEAAHLQQLNEWIAEQDRVRPPAPSVRKPAGFSEGRCTAVEGDVYQCSYSFIDGGRKQAVTANFVRSANDRWRIAK